MDVICLKAGIHRLSWPISFGEGSDNRGHTAQVSAVGRSGGGAPANANGVSLENSSVTSAPQRTLSSRFSFNFPFRSIWAGGRNGNKGIVLDDAVVIENGKLEEEEAEEEGIRLKTVEEMELNESEEKNESWVLKILRVRSLLGVNVLETEEKRNGDDAENNSNIGCCSCDGEETEGCGVDEKEEEKKKKMEFDRDSFSRLLKRVSLADAKFYARMSYLGNLAYDIPKIKVPEL